MKLEAATGWQQTQMTLNKADKMLLTSSTKTDPRFLDSESWIMTLDTHLTRQVLGGPRSIIDCIVGCDGERAVTAFMRVSKKLYNGP